MTFTPVVRWRNFTLSNLKVILEIYPDLSRNISRGSVNEILEENFSGYVKTAYQFACQLGLEDRSVDYLKVQSYLFSFSDENLEKYLEFWIKTYYSPNPFVQSAEEPFIIYQEVGNRVLGSESFQLDYTYFFNETCGGGSSDILLNTLIKFGKPLKHRKIASKDYIYIEESEKTELEGVLHKISSLFPIPDNPKDKGAFFERYTYKNFALFHGIDLSLETVEEPIIQTPSITKIPRDYNRLLIGAPGTGKSYLLKQESEGAAGLTGFFRPDNIERVTFYSNYSYSQFVGTYKPKPGSDSDTDSSLSHFITYEYVPGPFLRLLVRALDDYLKNKENCENFVLIIEEINRANNPAAVFGDIFQLLDRDASGKGEYEISCSEEMRRYLDKEGLSELKKLYLPPNFYIWSTMNSADQGVHPLDSAFQRRWSPEYIDINDNEEKALGYVVTIKGYGTCEWNDFRRALNQRLMELEVKDDKLIGPFFIKPEDLIDYESTDGDESKFQKVFKNKLIRYLSEDVFKHRNKLGLFGERKRFSQLLGDYDSGLVKLFYGINEEIFSLNNNNPAAFAETEII